MKIKKEKKQPHQVVVNNIIKPIKLVKGEKLIFVVGNENDFPPEKDWNRLKDEFESLNDAKTIMIPDAIKVYIVPKDTEIELYHGGKLKDV